MDNTSKKSMSKEDALVLLDLIEETPIITTKQTDAASNIQKDAAWADLTPRFNAITGTTRSKDQLKSKWDNLKKAARKRHTAMRMNNRNFFKTDNIPPDELLDRVSEIIGAACTSFTLQSEGDAADTAYNIAASIIPDSEVLMEVPLRPSTKKRRIIDVVPAPIASLTPRLSAKLKMHQNQKRKKVVESLVSRNLAIAKYYIKKAEKVDLEMKLLKIEIDKREKD